MKNEVNKHEENQVYRDGYNSGFEKGHKEGLERAMGITFLFGLVIFVIGLMIFTNHFEVIVK